MNKKELRRPPICYDEFSNKPNHNEKDRRPVMRKHFIRKRTIDQIISLRRNFAQTNGNVFNRILNLEDLIKSLKQEVSAYRNRIFSPIVTLQYFLLQALSADHSCREIVSQKVAELITKGSTVCSSNTASYCAARKRLSLRWIMGVMRKTAEQLHEESLRIWRGRSVKLIDGTTVSMPDTEKNQKKYPQNKVQKKGIGFPIARLVGIISLGCGSVLDIAIGTYEGKGTGEHSLLRKMLHNLKKMT